MGRGHRSAQQLVALPPFIPPKIQPSTTLERDYEPELEHKSRTKEIEVTITKPGVSATGGTNDLV